MDTTEEIPEFKIAKVGQERRRRGAGIPFLFGRGGAGRGLFGLGGSGRGLFGLGGLGGTGAGGAGGLTLLGKTLVLGLIGTMSAGAWQFGKSMRPEVEGAGGKKQIFASHAGQYSAEDLANLLKSDRSMPNSLGYVRGSLDGLTPEERARKLAEEEEARRKAEEEARIAEEEARKKEEEEARKAKEGAIDPNALLKGLAGKAGDKGGLKFGSLSSLGSGSGSSLNGGAGLSGGVARGFSAPALKNDAAAAGKLGAMRNAARPVVSRAGRSALGPSKNRGFARKQLAHAFGQSNQAVAARPAETAVEAANGAFDNNRGAGNVISGPGMSNGGGGAPTGPSTVGVNPGTTGDTGGTGQPLNPNDEAAPIPNQTGRNVTKYQPLVTAAQALLAIIALLSAIVLMVRGTLLEGSLGNTIKIIIGALGAMLSMLGIAIMTAYGQYIQGGIFTAVGAYVAAMAFIAPQSLMIGSNPVASAAAHALIGSAVGMLGSVFGGRRGGAAAMS